MIEDRLEEARLRSARRRVQIVIALLATVCVVVLVIFVLSLVDFSAKDVSLTPSDSNKDSLLIDKEQARREFKENLIQYERQLEPQLQDGNLESWNRDGLFELTELKKEILLFFSSGEYVKALGSLQLLKEKATTILEEAENIYNDNMEKAALYLEQDLYDKARLHINEALNIHPQSAEALALKDEIEKLPLILSLIDGAKVARAENDIQKEYDFLQQIVSQAPQRQEEAARLKMVADLLKEQGFEEHISSGYGAIEKAQLEEARFHYQEARKLAPQREELRLFADKISTLERSLRVRNYIKRAEQAAARDDWQQAKENYQKAVQDSPENKAVIEGLDKARHIIDLQVRLNQHLDNPYRLGNSGVRIDAENLVADVEDFLDSSHMLQRETGLLKEMISAMNRFVPVTVISDNQTHIAVRGVGKVGVVAEKTIQLKPGKYTFEGAREGFKSKLVDVFITYDLASYSLQIVCDEHI